MLFYIYCWNCIKVKDISYIMLHYNAQLWQILHVIHMDHWIAAARHWKSASTRFSGVSSSFLNDNKPKRYVVCKVTI